MRLAVAAADGFVSMSSASGGKSETVGDALLWYSTSSVPVFNGAGIFSEHLLRPCTLTAIYDYFRERSKPYSLLTVDGLTPDAHSVLTGMGYTEYDASPGMWLDGSPILWEPSSGRTSQLRVKQVSTLADLYLFRGLLTEVFQIPASEVNIVLSDMVLGAKHIRHYLAYLDDEGGEKAVGTITLVMSGTVPGIWNVGISYLYRRQGIAARLMRHALEEARLMGYGASMLLASHEGVSLYARLGYRTLSTVRMYVPSAGAFAP